MEDFTNGLTEIQRRLNDVIREISDKSASITTEDLNRISTTLFNASDHAAELAKMTQLAG